jgi:hypothetical protein
MSTKSSEVLVGRRYLERGFLDAAMASERASRRA